MTQVQAQINHMTQSIKDAAAKPALRPVLEAELLKLGNSVESVNEALDEFFGTKATLQ